MAEKEREADLFSGPAGFIFGGDTGLTYEELKRRRAIAAALASRQKGFPKNIGEGLTYLGESIGEAIGDWRLRQMEERNKAANAGLRTPAPEDTTPPVYVPPTPATPATPAPPEAPVTPAPAPGASVFPDPDPPPAAVAAVEPPPVAVEDPTEPPPLVGPAGGAPVRVGDRGPVVPRGVRTSSFMRPDTVPDVPPDVEAVVATEPPAVPVSQGRTGAPFFTIPEVDPANREPSPGTPTPGPDIPLPRPRSGLPSGNVPLPRPQPEIPLPVARPENLGAIQNPPMPPPRPGMLAPEPAAASAEPFVGPQDDPRWQARSRAIGGIESGGARDPYQLLGSITRSGDRAHGKYQVMGNNIAQWTKDALGYPMTRDEFLNSQNAQEATFRNRFGGYVGKYGEERAARAWYGGETGMHNLAATDMHGRLSVGGYGRDYRRRLGQPPGPEPAAGGGGPVSAAPPGISPAIAARLPQADPASAFSPRDAVAVALMNQDQPVPAVAPAQAPDEDVVSEERFRDVVGMRRPGSPFRATAARGDIGTDAPMPGLSPIGSATGAGIGDSVQQRQRIYDAVQQQRQAPAVPVEPDPTSAAVTPPQSTPTGTGSDPTRLAQAMQPGIRPDMPQQWYQPPAPAAAPPPPAPATVTDIRPAPDMPPSREAIPPASDEAPIVVPPERARPPLRGPNEREMHWMNVARDPRANEQTRAYATEMAARHAKWREAVQAQEQEEYKNYREKREALKDARDKQVREEPDRRLKQQAARTDLELKQAQASVAPLEARVKEADLALKQAQVAGIPNEVMKAELALRQAQATLEETQQRVNMGRAPPREKIGEQLLERQPDGTWKDVTPGTLTGNLRLTEQQTKGIKFFERSSLARRQGGNFAAMAGLTDTIAGAAPIGGNYWVSDKYQLQNNAADAWIENTLRDISGAAIRTEEYPTQKRIYFPQPGDNAATIAAKAERRLNAERSLYDSLGTAKPIADKYTADEQQRSDARQFGEGTVQRDPETGKTRTMRGGKWEYQ